MSYLSEIKNYANNLPPHMQKEYLLQVRKLKNDGVSYEWLYRALTNKNPEDWSNWGFGLLWSESYRAQITKLIEAEKKQLEGIDIENLSWEELFEEEGEEYPTEEIEIAESKQEAAYQLTENENNFIFSNLLDCDPERTRNSYISPTAELDFIY